MRIIPSEDYSPRVQNQGKQYFKYNGKGYDSMHGLNLYDYAARDYDPADIRFTTMDPHSEDDYSWSPYVYVGNNPMKFIDPRGRNWFVNNENANMGYIKDVSQITDQHREKYNLGTAKYENIGYSNESVGYGKELVYGGDYQGKILDQEFFNAGVLSEELMTSYCYEKAERVEMQEKMVTKEDDTNYYYLYLKAPDEMITAKNFCD